MKYILVIFIFMLVASCKDKQVEIKPPQPESIFNAYHNAVVIIRNEFIYKVQTDNGRIYYYSGMEDGNNFELHVNYDSAYRYKKTMFGTGFFIDKYGVIATNRHVIEGYEDLDKMEYSLKRHYDSLGEIIASILKPIEDTISTCEDYLKKDESQEIEEYADKLKEKANLYIEFLDDVQSIHEGRLKISPINYKIEVATDSTFNTTKDLIPCEKLRISHDNDIDLALIQTTNHLLPNNVSRFIPLNNTDNPFSSINDSTIGRPLRINTKLYMIGYNRAGTIGMTSNGLKPQLTQGTVSQESDAIQVLYSIPSLPGSSGSPVFDEWGNIVAINYSGYSSTQSFNYGIMVKHLKNLYDR